TVGGMGGRYTHLGGRRWKVGGRVGGSLDESCSRMRRRPLGLHLDSTSGKQPLHGFGQRLAGHFGFLGLLLLGEVSRRIGRAGLVADVAALLGESAQQLDEQVINLGLGGEAFERALAGLDDERRLSSAAGWFR